MDRIYCDLSSSHPVKNRTMLVVTNNTPRRPVQSSYSIYRSSTRHQSMSCPPYRCEKEKESAYTSDLQPE